MTPGPPDEQPRRDPRQLVSPAERTRLRRRFGPFFESFHDLDVGPHLLGGFVRRLRTGRRGEAVFVLERHDGRVLLHTKEGYPPGIWRLPSGGIERGERPEDAAVREVREETGFVVDDLHLLGMVGYRFHGDGGPVAHVSLVFRIAGVTGEPAAVDPSERISGFRWVARGSLAGVARDLRSLRSTPRDPERADWGRFRAVVHEEVARLP